MSKQERQEKSASNVLIFRHGKLFVIKLDSKVLLINGFIVVLSEYNTHTHYN